MTSSNLALMVKKALVDKGMTQKQLAEKIGLSEAVLSHFLRGRRKNLKEEERRAIAQALGLSPEALTETALPPPQRQGIRMVPVYPVGAGYDIAFGDGDAPVGESIESPIYTDVPDPNAFAGKVVGSSMELPSAGKKSPEPRGFREGDIVVFDTKAEVRSGCYCLVRFEDAATAGSGTTFKQVFLEGEEVRLHPLNPQFKDEVRPRTAVRALYRAVRHIRRI
jgi:transcriptional regulator with XRE-family HTH domain